MPVGTNPILHSIDNRPNTKVFDRPLNIETTYLITKNIHMQVLILNCRNMKPSLNSSVSINDIFTHVTANSHHAWVADFKKSQNQLLFFRFCIKNKIRFRGSHSPYSTNSSFTLLSISTSILGFRVSHSLFLSK